MKSGAFTVSKEHLDTKQKPLATTNVNLSVNGVKDSIRASSCLQKHNAAYVHTQANIHAGGEPVCN